MDEKMIARPASKPRHELSCRDGTLESSMIPVPANRPLMKSAARIQFWGTRGSLATPGRDTLRYGGNTSCVQITGDEGGVLVLDAGTGIRNLGRSLPSTLRRVDVLLTHLHMDHI